MARDPAKWLRQMRAAATRHAWLLPRVVLVLALSIASLVWPMLALGAAILVMVTFLSVPKAAPQQSLLFWLLAAAALLAMVASVRFIIVSAMPGLVRGGQSATEQRALSRLREVLTAQDAVRRLALIDHDDDGVGSAALIGELSGARPVRGGAVLVSPPLNHEYAQLMETRQGPAAVLGPYLFIVCLPTQPEGLSAQPSATFDWQKAESRFVAYAWPLDNAHGVRRAFFLDEHDRILVSENSEAGEFRYAGPNFPPPCEVALGPGASADWKPWRNKKPRSELPGWRP